MTYMTLSIKIYNIIPLRLPGLNCFYLCERCNFQTYVTDVCMHPPDTQKQLRTGNCGGLILRILISNIYNIIIKSYRVSILIF
jgi:hypothetical protein